jgi:hypothetical protein
MLSANDNISFKETTMSAASNYLENAVLNHVLRNTALSQPSGLWLALFTNTSGSAAANLEAGTLTDEISTSGTAYTRETVAFAAASGGSAATSATVTFDTATANWGTITHVAVMDAATSGNVLFYGAVTTSKTIETGDTFQVSSGNLSIALA